MAGLVRASGVPAHEVVEGALGVEHHRPQLARPWFPGGGGHQVGLVAHAAYPEGVRQPAGRVDGDHTGTQASPSAPGRERGGGGRLADPARSHAHDHDVAPARAAGQVIGTTSGWPSHGCLKGVGELLQLVRAELRTEAEGQLQLRERELAGQPGHLGGLRLLALRGELSGRRQGSPAPRAQLVPAAAACASSSAGRSFRRRQGQDREPRVHHDSAQRGAGASPPVAGRLDRLADRRLLGGSHQQDLAA